MTDSVYGNCPQCGAPGITRTRGIPCYDRCARGHRYLASSAIAAPKPAPEFTIYVCGFLFSPCKSLVILIQKARPAWQAGMLNGVGGKLEPGENPGRAMVREFYEETGVMIPLSQWDEFSVLHGPDFRIHYYRAFDDRWHHCRTVTDEMVRHYPVTALVGLRTAPSLSFMIPLALSDQDLQPVDFHRGTGDEAKAS